MIRFVMLGGFLGAGKTTAISRLAKHYIAEGLKIGIVTNDQAYDLVDTRSLRAQGFDVGEVPGACFCCKFNDLVETAAALAKEHQPDVIITEPVGSCTDLVATVIEPLRMLHGDDYRIAPLIVLLKPEHGMKILRAEQGSGFSPQAAYIFLKQIEEADVVAINKVDKLSTAERDELRRLVLERFPDKSILMTSGRTSEGFAELIDALRQERSATVKTMEVDYDVYAEGEAELGWLNCTAEVTSASERIQLDDLVRTIVERISQRLRGLGAETAHLKVLGESNGASAIANLVGSGVDVELSVESGAKVTKATVVVNARVVCDPLQLEEVVTESLCELANQQAVDVNLGEVQRFRPGRPEPTHRVQAS